MDQTVAIIDDDSSVLDALSLLLRTHSLTTATFTNARDFLTAPPVPGCIICDVRMPLMTGLELLHQIRGDQDFRPMILISGHGDVAMAVEAIKNGAFDFIEKPFENAQMVEVVTNALLVAETKFADKIELSELRDRYAALSERQREVMTFVLEGLSNKEIARELGISPRTVEVHRAWVMNKMGASSLADLIRKSLALS